jgi:hypothetical protein
VVKPNEYINLIMAEGGDSFGERALPRPMRARQRRERPAPGEGPRGGFAGRPGVGHDGSLTRSWDLSQRMRTDRPTISSRPSASKARAFG